MQQARRLRMHAALREAAAPGQALQQSRREGHTQRLAVEHMQAFHTIVG